MTSLTKPRRAGTTPAPSARVDRPSARRQPTTERDLLALITEAQSATDYEAALRTLCTGLCRLAGCDRVVLGIANQRSECRVVQVSDAVRVDHRAEITRAAEAAMDETLAKREIASWAVGDESPVFSRLTRLATADALVGMPLVDARGEAVGALLLFGGKSWRRGLGRDESLTAMQQPLAATLALIRRTRGSVTQRLHRAATSVGRRLRARFIIAAALVLGAVFVMPVPFKPKCNFTIEPVRRRYIAAPFDGTLQSTTVEPGDLVQAGQVLAELDERELKWELAGLEAEYVAAKKKRDAARAKQEAAPAQLAALEMEQIDTKLRTLRHRAEHLKIQCPIDGVVVSGDLRRTEGAPLSTGQTLFEVAPLDHMIAEIDIPQDEVSFVRPDMTVELRFDAFPSDAWSGKIAKLHPRAELRQGETVFIAEVHLENQKGTLRPGMNGRAKITVANRSLGWILFHRPLNALAQRIGW